MVLVVASRSSGNLQSQLGKRARACGFRLRVQMQRSPSPFFTSSELSGDCHSVVG